MRQINRAEARGIIELEENSIESERKVNEIFENDIASSIKSARENSQDGSYPELDLEKDIYLFDLFRKSIEQLPLKYREDPDFAIKFLKEQNNLFFHGQEKIFFDALPLNIKADYEFLDTLLDLFPDVGYRFFLDLSDEVQDVIPKDWFQSKWDEFASRYNFFSVNAKSIPWQLLSVEQSKSFIDEPRPISSFNFEVMPHQLKDGYKWHEDYEKYFNRIVAFMSRAEEYEDERGSLDSEKEDDILAITELSEWPEVYRKGLKYDVTSIKKAVQAVDFDFRFINTVIIQTGESIESLSLVEEAIDQIEAMIFSGKIMEAIKLSDFLPDKERDRYRHFFIFSEESNFVQSEIHIAFLIWRSKGIEGRIDDQQAEKIREQVIRRVYKKDHEDSEVVIEGRAKYKSYMAGVSNSDELFWTYLNKLDRGKALAVLSRFIEILLADEMEKGLGLRSNAFVLERILKSIESSDDARVTMQYMEGINSVSIDEFRDEKKLLDIHALNNRMCVDLFFEQHGQEIINFSVEDYDFVREMDVLKQMRAQMKMLTVGRKSNDSYREAKMHLEGRIKAQIEQIRYMKQIEEQAVFEIPDIVRNSLERNSDISPEDLNDMIFNTYRYAPRLSKATRAVVETKIKLYKKKYDAVRLYYQKYHNDQKELFSRTVPGYGVPSEKIDVMVNGISLIFVIGDRDYDYLNKEENSSRRSAALAFSYSKVMDLNGTIVMARRPHGSKDPYYQGLQDKMLNDDIKHENRHHEDRLFFSFDRAINSAKTEILAYLTDGSSKQHIISMLTDKEGLYYFHDVQEDEKWSKHCEQVVKAVNIAFAVGNVDALASTPINQWRKLLSHPALVK